MKILVTGAEGQLARSLRHIWSFSGSSFFMSKAQLDITNDKQVYKTLKKLDPDFVINTAAYTAVDRASFFPEDAFAVNQKGCYNLAQACDILDINLIHISTDYVFSGSQPHPYKPEDLIFPINRYGESKAGGECEIQEILPSATIIRTGWLYSSYGHNFVKTILRMLKTECELKVVYDQIGTPTSAFTLAFALHQFIKNPAPGIYHYTNTGCASWFDFAVAIAEEAQKLNLIKKMIPISPVPSSFFPTSASRPAYSVLDCTKAYEHIHFIPPHWKTDLQKVLALINMEKYK